MSIILKTDSYKVGHARQYPPGTTKVYSYFESRGGKWNESVFFGLQYLLKKHLTGKVVTMDAIDEADELFKAHFGRADMFNRKGWEHILTAHGGVLPLLIKAVPEGTVVPTHNVLMTVENTCPECYWLTNYMETLLVQAWYPITVATQSREIKRNILAYLTKTGDPDLVGFKLHDFGYRGVSSHESAGIGGAAHLVNFLGTDTIAALDLIRRYYGHDCAGFSIPASEHSTITSWGREHELDAYRNMLDQYPTGLVACVSDSFNIYEACRELWGKQLRDQVLSRDGVLVIRPDSGHPASVVVEVVKILAEAFGVTYNSKGYKVLNPHVRVIQGDGVNIDSITEILRSLAQMDFSADNVAFGMGGALLQKLDRDTLRMAFKCSYVEGSYGVRDVYKQPITDPGKDSKRGRLALVSAGGQLHTQPEHLTPPQDNKLVTVFKDGLLMVNHNLAQIRERAAI